MRNFIKFYHLGNGVSIAPFCDIHSRAAQFIAINSRVIIHKDVWLNVAFEGPVAKPPIITIDSGTAIGRRCTISGVKNIYIGKNVMLAPNVFITDHLHEHKDPDKPISLQGVSAPGSITIEAGCWLGHGCSIIASEGKVITLGKNTIVSANTVVTKSFPEYSTLFGIPARNVANLTKR